jgi:predicted Zn-dependent peptidase
MSIISTASTLSRRQILLGMIGGALLSTSSLSNPVSAAHSQPGIGADIQQHTEPNGLSITLAPIAGTASVSGTITVRWGTSDQPVGQRADAHILEHAWFLTTTGRESGEIDRLLEEIGVAVNATTSRDAIVITFTAPKASWRDAFVLITERMLRPAHLPAELASEKVPFLTEVDLLREDSQRNILDRLLTASAGPAFAASTGEPSRLTAPDISALTQLQRAIVVPGRISVALAGDIDREDARSVVNACFPDTPGSMLRRTSRELVATTRIATLPLTTPLHVATGVFIPTSTGKAGMDIASAHAADLAVMNVIHQALRTQLTVSIPVSKNAVPQRIDASCSSILHRGLSGVLLRIDHTAASAQPVDMFLTALKAAQTLIADESQATGVITATRRIWAEQAALPAQVVARQAEWDALDEPAGPVMLLKALSQLTPAQLMDHIDRIVLRFSLRQEVAL